MSSNNDEKAHALLNRWVATLKELNSQTPLKRPKEVDDCNNLQDCERWRNQVIKEITKRVADIQNASLGEFKIREMNDDINKLFKEKSDWEDKIKYLGGPDYKKLAPKNFDSEGYEVPNSGGYKYWGAAKNLPGVRELFIKKPPNAPRRNIFELYKNIDLDYYGDINDDDDDILKEESEKEKLLFMEYLGKIEFENINLPVKKVKENDDGDSRNVYKVKKENVSEKDLEIFKLLHSNNFDKIDEKVSEEEIMNDILEKKKKQILQMLDHI
jgi:pre-mRNA-splicing factor ISY1